MSVRVVRTDHDRDYVPFEHTHADAVGYDIASDPHVGGIVLHVFNADHRRVATYAPGVWASAELMSEPEPVDAAAPLNGYSTGGNVPEAAEATLFETSEPYVSVSVSANGSDELAKLIRKFIRVKAERDERRGPHENPGDDGAAGVREPLRPRP